MASEPWGTAVQEGSKLNALLADLKECSRTQNLAKGKQVHRKAIECGHDSSIYVANAIMDMYAKCCSIDDAHQLFSYLKHPTVVSWNVLIMGYAANGQGQTSLRLFARMRTEGPPPDCVTFVAALKACISLAAKEEPNGFVECKDRGKAIHNLATQNCNMYVKNALIGMYAKCGRMVDANQVFKTIKRPNAVSWNALIFGYVDNEQAHAALDLFIRMRIEGCAPDTITFMAALKACSLVGAIELGRTIHSEIETENNLGVVLVNCLVDFYAKCGSLVEARSVFDLHSGTRNLVTWNVLLAGFSSCGDNEAVFGLFDEMQDAGFWPDGLTFLCILTCCSHAGLVDKGKECFDSMSTKFGIIPSIKHYTCMIDVFGRSNKLDDAMVWLKCMPSRPNSVTWQTVLGACRKWKNVEIGRLALVNLNGKD